MINMTTTFCGLSNAFACPQCGGKRFEIGIDTIWFDPESYRKDTKDWQKERYAECLDCGVSILTMFLKEKYHKDKRKDFEAEETEDVVITFVCSKRGCKQSFSVNNTYKRTMLFGTAHDILEPGFIPDWKYPKHPDIVPTMCACDVKDLEKAPVVKRRGK